MNSNYLVRGNIFVFDFSNKRFWRHPEIIKKPSVAVASVKEFNQYVVGTKEGVLVVLDVGKLIDLIM